MNADGRRCAKGALLVLAALVAVVAHAPSRVLSVAPEPATGVPPCTAEDVERLSRVPAISEEYKKFQDMQYWRNPYITVQRDGVELKHGGTRKGLHIAISELPRALAELPQSAWPYGRVVVVTDQGIIGSIPESRVIEENRTRVVALLKCLRVQINLVPSA